MDWGAVGSWVGSGIAAIAALGALYSYGARKDRALRKRIEDVNAAHQTAYNLHAERTAALVQSARDDAARALAQHAERTDNALTVSITRVHDRIDRIEGTMARRTDVDALTTAVGNLTGRIDRVLEGHR